MNGTFSKYGVTLFDVSGVIWMFIVHLLELSNRVIKTVRSILFFVRESKAFTYCYGVVFEFIPKGNILNIPLAVFTKAWMLEMILSECCFFFSF